MLTYYAHATAQTEDYGSLFEYLGDDVIELLDETIQVKLVLLANNDEEALVKVKDALEENWPGVDFKIRCGASSHNFEFCKAEATK